MTTYTEAMNQFQVGQAVVFTEEYQDYPIGQPWNRTTYFKADVNTSTATVVKVNARKILVRIEGKGSFWVGPYNIKPLDANAPMLRKLGETPPDGAISIHDPHLQWIWEDMATFAEQQNWCSEYDKLADKFGIPGRERNFTVKLTINGLDIATKIKARSKDLAEKAAYKALGLDIA